MPSFAEALNSGRFLVTAELNPPKGTDLSALLEDADVLKRYVDAMNLTDSASALMTMAPVAAAFRLKEKGIEPILQLTGRDRNRIALQGDMLAASALGVTTVLCMGGDPPSTGDHPDAKGVFDLDAIGILKAVEALNSGKDLSGHDLKGATSLCAGAVMNPGNPDPDRELRRMEEKVQAGAKFFQTQAVYEPRAFDDFMQKAKGFGVPVIAGFIVLKSANMARRLKATLPGLSIPEPLIDEMESATNRVAKSVEISGRILHELRGLCGGVHVMAIGWEESVPAILDSARIPARPHAHGV